MITLIGESFFLNRCINNHFTGITSIAVGKGTNLPKLKDTGLGAETVRKTPTMTVDLEKYQVVLTAIFEAHEIMNCTEIGVFSEDKLLARDVFKEINVENGFLYNDTSQVTLTYNFNIGAGNHRNNWKALDMPGVYQVTELANVELVYDENGNGYRKEENLDNIKTMEGTYYQNKNTHTLYIHTWDNKTPENIIVKTG